MTDLEVMVMFWAGPPGVRPAGRAAEHPALAAIAGPRLAAARTKVFKSMLACGWRGYEDGRGTVVVVTTTGFINVSLACHFCHLS